MFSLSRLRWRCGVRRHMVCVISLVVIRAIIIKYIFCPVIRIYDDIVVEWRPFLVLPLASTPPNSFFSLMCERIYLYIVCRSEQSETAKKKKMTNDSMNDKFQSELCVVDAFNIVWQAHNASQVTFIHFCRRGFVIAFILSFLPSMKWQKLKYRFGWYRCRHRRRFLRSYHFFSLNFFRIFRFGFVCIAFLSTCAQCLYSLLDMHPFSSPLYYSNLHKDELMPSNNIFLSFYRFVESTLSRLTVRIDDVE